MVLNVGELPLFGALDGNLGHLYLRVAIVKNQQPGLKFLAGLSAQF